MTTNFERLGQYTDGRHGSSTFYKLLSEMAETHDKKSHDYASNQNPYGNYHFAGKVAQLFAHSEQDAGFVGRIAEKIYRLANLEGSQKIPSNESIEDTERDICVITALWMADRRDRRKTRLENIDKIKNQMNQGEWSSSYGETPASSTTGKTILSSQILPVKNKEMEVMTDFFKIVEDYEPRDIQQIIDYLTRLRRDKLAITFTSTPARQGNITESEQVKNIKDK